VKYLVEQSLNILSHTSLENIGITLENLSTLIENLLIMSLKREEGRFPHFFCYIPSKEEYENKRVQLTVLFEEPLHASIKNLYKIFSAVPQKPFALIISEKIDIEGIGLVNHSVNALYSKNIGLLLHVISPGHLMLTLENFNVEIRDGSVRKISYINENDLYKSLLGKLSQSVSNNESEVPFIDLYMQKIFNRVLEKCVALQHGGTFLILQEGSSLEMFDIKHKTKQAVNIIETILLSKKINDSMKKQDVTTMQPFYSEMQKIESYITNFSDSLPLLSAIDGCVILDNKLRILGFGSKINQLDIPEDKKSIVEHSGMRHRSAASACIHLPNSAAFVVSQDGDITIFCNTNENGFEHVKELKTKPF
jgi:hypothetical protein